MAVAVVENPNAGISDGLGIKQVQIRVCETTKYNINVLVRARPPSLPIPRPSPLDHIPTRPSLKRSASLASLPTPPRTRRRRGGQSRGGDSESSSSEEEHVATDDEEEKRGRYKRRKIQEEKDEDDFWGAASGSKHHEKERGRPLVYRRLQAQKLATKTTTTTTAPAPQATSNIIAPVSPPPSHRKPAPPPVTSLPKPDLKTPSPPSTPKKKSIPSKPIPLFALRDSPDNPFLDTPQNVPETDTPNVDAEKPFITYNLRKPILQPRTGRAYSPPPGARLPPDHPDFEPDERCGPRVLEGKTPTPELDSDEEITPRKLDFSVTKGRRLNVSARKRVRNLLEEMAEAQHEN
ncbi:hypothetical protein BDQ17DRAFT_1361255 [Cyathus striatus]|nr:hypothetical protein BDQ17DRAFT_1361255 [Cyathus striatus]